MYINFSSSPLCLSELSYCGFALLKSSLLEEMTEIRRQMAAGRCFVIVGRWLELYDVESFVVGLSVWIVASVCEV